MKAGPTKQVGFDRPGCRKGYQSFVSLLDWTIVCLSPSYFLVLFCTGGW